MKRTLKDRLMGVIIGIIIGATMITTAFAATGAIQKTLEYNNIKITLDGEEVIPKDANGNYVEPFTIEGTTYLPVRAISNALGLDVGWDGATKTVKLTTPQESVDEQKPVDVEDQNVIYNENGVKVTYQDYFVKNYSNVEIHLLIENNSPQDIKITPEKTAINGIAFSTGGTISVAKGTESYGIFHVYTSNCADYGVDVYNITELQIKFNYYLSGQKCNSDYITLPINAVESTTTPEEVVSEEGNVIYNENGIRVTYQDYYVKNYANMEINLLIENNSPQDIKITPEKTAINGIAFSTGGTISVAKGTESYGTFHVYTSNCADYGIDINNFTELRIKFYYNYNGKKCNSDYITLLK